MASNLEIIKPSLPWPKKKSRFQAELTETSKQKFYCKMRTAFKQCFCPATMQSLGGKSSDWGLSNGLTWAAKGLEKRRQEEAKQPPVKRHRHTCAQKPVTCSSAPDRSALHQSRAQNGLGENFSLFPVAYLNPWGTKAAKAEQKGFQSKAVPGPEHVQAPLPAPQCQHTPQHWAQEQHCSFMENVLLFTDKQSSRVMDLYSIKCITCTSQLHTHCQGKRESVTLQKKHKKLAPTLKNYLATSSISSPTSLVPLSKGSTPTSLRLQN